MHSSAVLQKHLSEEQIAGINRAWEEAGCKWGLEEPCNPSTKDEDVGDGYMLLASLLGYVKLPEVRDHASCKTCFVLGSAKNAKCCGVIKILFIFCCLHCVSRSEWL